MAGSVGMGYAFGYGLQINLGYAHSFSNIAKSDAFGSVKISNQAFKLTLGHTFGKKN